MEGNCGAADRSSGSAGALTTVLRSREGSSQRHASSHGKRARPDAAAIKVAVLDMQPITPTIGGGRVRLFGMYHNLGPNIDCTYVGTYDWPGEPARRNQLSDGLLEITIPLSERQFDLTERFRQGAGSQTLIDTLFWSLGHVSTEYVEAAEAVVADAHVVVFSHPWVYPLVAPKLDGKIVIYDSHNIEALLKAQGLAHTPLGLEILKSVLLVEAQLLARAHHVFCCSVEDRNGLALVYGTPLEKISIAPNGVLLPHKPAVRTWPARGASPTAIFVGSAFGPNIEAAKTIVTRIAPLCPSVAFVILGGAGDDHAVRNAARTVQNVTLTGVVTDDDKARWFERATVAVNPMQSGSGTNIKMFDFMAAGLPVVTTAIGARGISRVTQGGIRISDLDAFPAAIQDIFAMPPAECEALGRANQDWVEADFSWAKISALAGQAIETLYSGKRRRATPPPSATCAEARRDGESPQHIVLLSTFGVHCGVAGYTEYLAQAMIRQGHNVSVIAAKTPRQDPDTRLETIRVAIGWYWDNVTWMKSRIDPATVLDAFAIPAGAIVSIQYHPAFYAPDRLVAIVKEARKRKLRVGVTFHSSRRLNRAAIEAIAAAGAMLFFHSKDEIAAHAVAGSRFLPHGVPNAGANDAAETPPLPVVGSFGFLRPHKGLRHLIRAMPLVRDVVPDVKLRAFCALYPSDDSRAEARLCEDLIARNALHGVVELQTAFIESRTVQSELARHAVNILPYDASDEGASGAAGMCIGARAPLVTSQAEIFDEIGDAAYRLSGTGLHEIALCLINLLMNSELRSHYKIAANAYADAHSWDAVARGFTAELAHA